MSLSGASNNFLRFSIPILDGGLKTIARFSVCSFILFSLFFPYGTVKPVLLRAWPEKENKTLKTD